MVSRRRKPRDPFPYVLAADRALPEVEQPRFVIAPPSSRIWTEIIDGSLGSNGALLDAVIRCVDRLENDPDAGAFGRPGSEERKAYVDEMDIVVIRELGTAVAETLLSETDRKN